MMRWSWAYPILRRLLRDYSLYRIYAWESDRVASAPGLKAGIRVDRVASLGPLRDAADPELRALTQYAGEEAFGFGVWADDTLAGVCWYWTGERYRTRNFWPLQEGEAKLVQIVTGAGFRRQGLAALLVERSSSEMAALGFRRLFARVWHSNRASIRTFERAGWRYVAFVAEVQPLLGPRRLRWVSRR